MQVKLQYYALLREQAGRSEEQYSTSARTARELYAELRHRYLFTLPADMLRVGVNAEFADCLRRLCLVRGLGAPASVGGRTAFPCT